MFPFFPHAEYKPPKIAEEFRGESGAAGEDAHVVIRRDRVGDGNASGALVVKYLK